jgi:hypothetical protein
MLHPKPICRAKNHGFAVVIALMLMSFVLVMILSLTTLVSVETTNAARALNRILAQENARLGLLVALGNMQKLAGPDKKVTFRADALDSENTFQNPYWVGVMDVDTPTSNPEEITWLVSTHPSDAETPMTSLSASNSHRITPDSISADDAVLVPLRDIDSKSNQYGYWVSDESIKASIATRPVIDEQSSDWLEDNFSQTESERLQQMVPKRAGIEMLFPSLSEDDEFISSQLNRVTSLDQLRLTNAWDFTLYDDFFHDVSGSSLGVLASTTGTGLKKDLSLRPDLMPIPGKFDKVYDYAAYMEEPLPSFNLSTPYIPFEEDLRRRYKITAPTTTSPGEISDGIYPVLTSFRIQLGVHVAGSEVTSKTLGSFSPITDKDELVVRVQLHAELWNPYTSALVPENLVLRVNNLPTVSVELESGSSGGARTNLGTYSIDLNRLLGNGGRGRGVLKGYFVELPFTDQGYPNHDDFSWLPGRIYNWVGQNNFSNGSSKINKEGSFNSRSLGNGIFYKGTGITAPTSTDWIGISAPSSDISVSLRNLGSGGSLTSGEELFIIEDINYDGFNTGPTIDSYSRSVRFGYQIQRDESGFESGLLTGGIPDPWEVSNWLRVEDPRSSKPTFDETGQRIGAFVPPLGTEPTAYISSSVKQPNFLFDRTAPQSAGSKGYYSSHDVPLFELFRQRPISIGELQHLNIIGNRPFTVGNSWGEDTTSRFNRIFDEAFFSGLAPGDNTPDISSGEALPNHRLRPISTERTATSLKDLLDEGEYSSKKFLAEGSFNINSTSGNAWSAILGSIFIREWEVANIDINGDLDIRTPRLPVSMGQAILRFPQSAQEVFDTGPKETSIEPPTEYFRVGAKFFRDNSGKSDSEPYKLLGKAIAKRIGERIRLFGPYVSIEEFLAPVESDSFRDPKDSTRYLSAMERAILDVPEINQTDSGDEIWHHTSSFLSQADVMTGLAPIATTRGDTFLIRSVGRSQTDLQGNDIATVICEARIQRIPEVLDPIDGVVTPSNTGFGRKFVIASLRWVNE